MDLKAETASKPEGLALTMLAIAGSAVAFFFGTGLHPIWWLTWLAPLPALLIAPRVSRWKSFAVAFAAFTIGALNVWSYDRIVTPLWLTIFILIVPSLVFAFVVLAHRRFILRGQTLRAVFALPVLWSAVEYLAEFHSVHSTWGNLAYTQMNCLPLIQIASITGIWSISFIVFLFPSTVAVLLAPGRRAFAKPATPGLALAAAIFILVFGYGFYRLATTPQSPRVTVALISTDKHLSPHGPATVDLVRLYVAQIPPLATQGVKVIVLPEKIGHIQGDDLAQADAIFEQAARDNHVTIFVSFEHEPNLHEARLYSPDGRLEGTYEKHHLLPAFESHLLPGTARLTFNRSLTTEQKGSGGSKSARTWTSRSSPASTQTTEPASCSSPHGTSSPTAGCTAAWRSCAASRVDSASPAPSSRESSPSATTVAASSPSTSPAQRPSTSSSAPSLSAAARLSTSTQEIGSHGSTWFSPCCSFCPTQRG